MQKIQNAFFCTTPYQIITSVVLNYIFEESSDIYIVPQFKSAAEYADNLQKLNLFNRVKLVDTTDLEKHKLAKNKLLMHAGIVGQYFKVNKIANAFLFPDTIYSKMFVSSKAYIPRMAYLYYVKQHFDTELVYYDDGEGSYYNRYRIEASVIDNLVRRVLFGKKAIDGTHTLYLYEPGLYKALNGNHWNGDIVSIPHLVDKNPINDWMKEIFEIDQEDLISERVIILDVLKERKYSSGDINRLFEIYGRIQEVYGYNETIIKRHPRDKTSALSSFKCYDRYNIPFECLCTQMNMEDKVLMAISSTSVIIPKLLLGKEPTVILLYKLIAQINQSDDYRNRQDHFYKLCKESYSSVDKFFVPETFEELDGILRALTLKNSVSQGEKA